MNTWNERVKSGREALNLKKSEFAHRVGVSAATVTDWENGNIKKLEAENLLKISVVLGIEPADIIYGPPRGQTSSGPRGELSLAPPNTRRIPVISYIQAGDPKPIIDDHAPGNGIDDIWVGGTTAKKLGSYSFALIVEGDSMEPDFLPGDQIIVDPEVVPRPGEIVVAKMGREEEGTLKKYRARGSDENGVEIFELVPINNNHATILVNAANPGRIIGTVMHHLRNMRR